MDGICPFVEQISGVTTFNQGMVDRVGFCDHTASGYLRTMRDPEFWKNQQTSVHFAVGRDGSAIQLVNIFDTAWAQGRLGPTINWPPFQQMGGRNPNGYLISTEHEDYELVNGVSTFVPGSRWTPAQYETDLKIKRWCVEEVKRVKGLDILRFGIGSLAGHHMFDNVNRAECPGKYWREEYRSSLFNDLTFGGIVEGPTEEMMHKWFGQHPKFNGSASTPVSTPKGQPMVLNVSEFGLKPGVKQIRFEVFKDFPNYVGVGHGDTSYAGCIMIDEKHDTVDVQPNPDGTFVLDAAYGAVGIWELRVCGYWD